MDEKNVFIRFRQVTTLLRYSNVLNLRLIDQTAKKGSPLTVKTRIQKFCLWRRFLGQVGLRQDKTALKSVEPGRIISRTVETLKSKTVLSTQKFDNTENEFPIKLPEKQF